MASCGTILVVDHDDATRTAAVSVAERLGYLTRADEDAESVLARLDEEPPVLAIVEVELTGASGLELLCELHEAYGADLPVILVSAERTAPLDRVAGLLLGADDYVSKPFDEGELLARARRSLSRAGAPIGDANGNGLHDGGIALSPRELEILTLLSHGYGQLEIARTLVVSPKTIGTHIQHILSKLGVHSRAQAVAEAYRLGLASPDFAAHMVDVA